MSNTLVDRDGNALEPGALYCCFYRTDEFESARDGEMVYWTGTELVDENGEETEAEFDFLVRQTGAAINPDMIDNRPWDIVAEERNEARAHRNQK